MDLAGTEGGNLVFAVSDSVLGRAGTEAFQLLVITSLFAAILTFHNNVARYMFSLGRQGVIWSRLGTTHPTRQSPALACYVQIAMVAVVVAVFAIFNLDPYTTLFTWWTGVGAAGIILLQTIASIAIFVFFRRSDVDKGRGIRSSHHCWASPGLLPFLWYAVTGMDVLLGGGGGCRPSSPLCCSHRWPSASSAHTSSNTARHNSMRN